MTGHYCGHCGIAIPADEIESGASRGTTGDHFCAKHRGGGTAVATAAHKRAPLGGVDDWEADLLFCSNCQVSIPQYDVRSGRSRSEYGSMLCAVCVKATPGERAARREAVEAEMRADMEADDPIGPLGGPARAPVAVPPKPSPPPVVVQTAPVRERPVSPSPVPVSSPPVGAGAGNAVLIAGVFLLVGVVGASLFMPSETAAPPVDHKADFARIEERLTALNGRLDDVRRSVRDGSRDGGAVVKELRGAIDRVRFDIARDQEAADVVARNDVSRANAEVTQRLAKLEGGVEQLTNQIATLATRVSQQPTVVVREAAAPPKAAPSAEPPKGAEANGNAGPVAPTPEARALMKDLLESEENGVRFAAASKLGRMGIEAAIPVLVQALAKDENYLVKRACTHALREFKAWNAVPALIDALEDKEPSVAHASGQALLVITGQDFGVDWEQTLGERKRRAREARNWWKANKEKPPQGVSLHPVEMP